MEKLAGKKLLMFMEDLYEDLELWYPRLRMIEEGAEVIVAAPEGGKVYRGKNGYPCQADAALVDVRAEEIDGLIRAEEIHIRMIAKIMATLEGGTS